ncbi:hypothetical protein [Chryseobacterium carnipullorum]|uniref:hypothetical protein n=1 Tax=Chryseobacterium carnipullorum TaxID=1124835 RepID=UPI000E846148|nr:hypothetical protein [Chryseobacterium carnipullorum]HBV14808.1 hypothetical protein [Chryseobacterium carnipullorum]
MTNNIFCCDSLSTALDNAGNSGFSVLVAMNTFNKTFFFVQQYRTRDKNDKTGILTIGEVGIKFCPWCGCDLERVINDNFELAKDNYEKNKEFLFEF